MAVAAPAAAAPGTAPQTPPAPSAGPRAALHERLPAVGCGPAARPPPQSAGGAAAGGARPLPCCAGPWVPGRPPAASHQRPGAAACRALLEQAVVPVAAAPPCPCRRRCLCRQCGRRPCLPKHLQRGRGSQRDGEGEWNDLVRSSGPGTRLDVAPPAVGSAASPASAGSAAQTRGPSMAVLRTVLYSAAQLRRRSPSAKHARSREVTACAPRCIMLPPPPLPPACAQLPPTLSNKCSLRWKALSPTVNQVRLQA